jgi:hypothetical protein
MSQLDWMKLHFPVFFLAILILLASCETAPNGVEQARAAMAARIATEPAGDYFIGRRYFKSGFYFWGFVRRPRQSWSDAKLVVLNENQQLAPDREQLGLGADNGFEYKLRGYFSGDQVYELVSNQFLPEFVLQGYELISTNPAPILPSQIHGQQVGTGEIERPE